jgi:hypothetical protein
MNPHMSQFRTDGLTITDREGEGWVPKKRARELAGIRYQSGPERSARRALFGGHKQGVVLSVIV